MGEVKDDERLVDPHSIAETLVSGAAGVHFKEGIVTIPFTVHRPGPERTEQVIVARIAMTTAAFSNFVVFLNDAKAAWQQAAAGERVTKQ